MPAKVVLVISAGQGSRALPDKALSEVAGKPIIAHIIERLRNCADVDEVVLAASGHPEDKPLLEAGQACGVPVFAGHEEDILDRLYEAARAYRADVLVHINGNSPFADPSLVDRAVQAYFVQHLDYVTNTFVRTFPSGLDIEIFSLSALGRAWKEARLPTDRRQVGSYFRRHRNDFQIYHFENFKNFAALRWTLDSAEDLAFVREVYACLYLDGKVFQQKDILDLLERRPDIAAINQALGPLQPSADWDSGGDLTVLQMDLIASAAKAVEANQRNNFIEAEKCYGEVIALAEELIKRARALKRSSQS